MSTARLFAPHPPPQPYAEVERQRDEFQLQAAQYRLLLDEVQKFFAEPPTYDLGEDSIVVVGWDDMRKKVDEVLR